MLTMNSEEAHKFVEFGKNNFHETWIPVPEKNETYKDAKKIISENNSGIKLRAICSVKEGGHYVCSVYGGLNGRGEWVNYFSDLKTIFEKLGHAWLIEIKNDWLDDLWSATFCFKNNITH